MALQLLDMGPAAALGSRLSVCLSKRYEGLKHKTADFVDCGLILFFVKG